MNVGSMFQFVIGHNAAIIEGLVAAILLTVLFLAYKNFLSAREQDLHGPSLGATPDMSQLEEALKKILERANQITATPVTSAAPAPSAVAPAPAAGGKPADKAGSSTGDAAKVDTAPLLAEINNLKKNLEDKQAQIEQMKSATPSAAPAAGGGLSDDERAKLEAQIKDFQSKLAEYEIISEDIADLSFYKEENSKLQRQIEGFKSGKPAAAEPAAAAPPPPAPAAAPAAPVAPVAVEAVAPTPAAPEAAPEMPAAPMAAGATAEPLADEPNPDLVDEDLVKGLEEVVAQQTGMAPAAADDDLNMEKMLAETAAMAPAKGAVKNSMTDNIDAEKLLAEANSMKGAAPKGKSDESDVMGEFENFVKKGAAG